MEEKKQIKFNLKHIIIIALLIFIIITVFFITSNTKEINIDGKIYYKKLNRNTYNEDFEQKEFYTSDKIDNIIKVVSYTEYLDIINQINSISSEKINNQYIQNNSNYIILSYANGYSWCEMELIDCIENDNKIIIYGDEQIQGVMGSGSGYFIAIPTNLPVGTEVEYRECYSNLELINLRLFKTQDNPFFRSIDKPVIYLYPTKETEISVKLLKAENLTCSYPKYKDEWKVLAQNNGDLRDLSTNRQLYSLYYESKSDIEFKVEKEGFIVNGVDAITFLEEKLAILGLTEKEAEEFIIYWLPKLETNKYNYIRFATIEEINENMPLKIDPNPDTLIRVLMTYKGLENPIEVQEQHLETPNRTGFVTVEWGGTEIK